MPTRRLGSDGGVSPFNASDRSVGLILAAQPQVLARPVNVFFLKNCINGFLFHEQDLEWQMGKVQRFLFNIFENVVPLF